MFIKLESEYERDKSDLEGLSPLLENVLSCSTILPKDHLVLGKRHFRDMLLLCGRG
jgi:hypothetical protein